MEGGSITCKVCGKRYYKSEWGREGAEQKAKECQAKEKPEFKFRRGNRVKTVVNGEIGKVVKTIIEEGSHYPTYLVKFVSGSTAVRAEEDLTLAVKGEL